MGLPIPWAAISGLAGTGPTRATRSTRSAISLPGPALHLPHQALTVPAIITDRLAVGEAEPTIRPWASTTSRASRSDRRAASGWPPRAACRRAAHCPNLIVRAEADGTVVEGIELPAEAVAGATNSGLEGIAVTGTEAGGDETRWVVQQRPGTRGRGTVKVGRYRRRCGCVDLRGLPPRRARVALPAAGSDCPNITVRLTAAWPSWSATTRLGQAAAVKRVYGIDPTSVEFVAAGGESPLLEKTLLRDILPTWRRPASPSPTRSRAWLSAPTASSISPPTTTAWMGTTARAVFIRLGSVEEAFGQE